MWTFRNNGKMVEHDPVQHIAQLKSHYDETSASLTLAYLGSEFEISFDLSDETTPTVAEYQTAIEPVHNPSSGPALLRANDNVLRTLLQPLRGMIEDRTEPTSISKDVTLQQLLLAPRHRLHVHKDNSISSQCTKAGPTYGLLPICIDAFAQDEINHLLRVPSSDIEFVEFDHRRPSLQGEVRAGDNERAFFKPALKGGKQETTREIGVLKALYKQLFSVRHSTILGLAITEDGSKVAGILFHWIEGIPLAEVGLARREEYRTCWRNQLAEFVEFLHCAGKTWGDINEHNVLVEDQDGDPILWAIDFAGIPGTNCDSLQFEHQKSQDWSQLSEIFGEPEESKDQ